MTSVWPSFLKCQQLTYRSNTNTTQWKKRRRDETPAEIEQAKKDAFYRIGTSEDIGHQKMGRYVRRYEQGNKQKKVLTTTSGLFF